MNDEEKTTKKKSNKLVKVSAAVLTLLIVSSGMAYMLSLNDEAGDELVKDPTLGERLDSAGWMLFAMTDCPACEIQKEVLGHDRFDITIETCERGAPCIEVAEQNDLIGFPTWHNVFTNETRIGFQNSTQLEEMAR